MAPLIDEIHRVVYVDGIYLGRKAVILIAKSDDYVLGWYLARTENSVAWEALLSRIAPPKMVVSDGGSGFEKARKRVWGDTAVQRCTFHVFCQVKRYTTTRPNLAAGIELYGLARELLHIKDLKSADRWVERYIKWCQDWESFLNEKTYDDNRNWVWTHERLVKARNSLNTLIHKGTLFTYLDPRLTDDRPLPTTNNKIEGGVNALLRQLLRDHRGMSIDRRIKAIFWWCYMHTEYPLSPAQILKTFPTDDGINSLYRSYTKAKEQDGPQRWGDGIVWSEFHGSDPYRMDYD
ncbi:transposase [Actinomycetota bacterium]|nr:transposase [Actinomycetota bacterium]